MEDPRADQKNVSGLIILSNHTFLVLTDISFYNRRIRAQIRERRVVIPNQSHLKRKATCL